MDPMLWIITIPLLVMVLVGGGLWLLSLTIRRRWDRHRANTVDKWQAEGVEFVKGPAGGNFGGLESDGAMGTVRGIGFVVLTEDDLRVTRAVPPGVWYIPLRHIERVMLRPAFLTKQGKVPFIVVEFIDEERGEIDRLGFRLKQFEAWVEAIAEAAGVPVEDERE